MGKIKIREDRCKGCGLCIIYCEKKLISPAKHLNAYGAHPVTFRDCGECSACTFCAQVCPDMAIEVYR